MALDAQGDHPKIPPKKKGKKATKRKPSAPSVTPDQADRVRAHSTAPPKTPDQIDRTRHPRTPPPPVKERRFAHPTRPGPQKAISEYVAEVEQEKEHREGLKKVARRIHVTPAPSPDAKDSERSPTQKKRDREAAADSVRTSRLRAVRKGHRGAGVRQVKAELEGKGVIAKGFKNLGERSVKSTRNPTLSYATQVSTDDNIGSRALKDAFNLPAQVVPSIYVPAAGLYEAGKSKGKDTKRLKEFGKSIDEHDAVYNLGAALVEAAGGDSKSAKKRLDAAGKSANEHPGFAAAEVAGIKGIVGRGTGAALRHAPGSSPAATAARSAGSTTRASRTTAGTSLREDRSFSPDAITKAAQVVAEKVNRKRTARLRKKADEHETRGNDPRAEELRQKAAGLDPDRPMSEAEIQKRVDEHVDANETVRRGHRGETVNDTRAAVKEAGADKAGPLASLITQGIAHPDPADLRDYVTELEHEYPKLSNAGKRANKQLRKGIEKALDRDAKGKIDWPKLESLAEKYREGQAGREKALDDRGMLPSDQAAKAAAIPYAVRRIPGVRHTNDHRVAAADAAKTSRDHARARVARLEKEKDELTGKHRVARAQDAAKEPQAKYVVDGHEFPTRAGAEAHSAAHGGAEVKKVSLTLAEAKRVGEASRNERALKAARAEFGKRESEYLTARKGRNTKELVDASGKPLSLSTIHAHMVANGEPLPSWLTQAPNSRGARNFFQSSTRPPHIKDEPRTGEATRGGTFDAHPDVLTEQAARQQGLIDAFDGYHGFLDEFALKSDDGRGHVRGLTNAKQVDEAIRNAMFDEHGKPRPGAVKWVKVRTNPFGGRLEQLAKMLESTDAASHLGAEAINDAIAAALKGDGEGPWAIVPEAAAKRLQEHVRVLNPGNVGKIAQKGNTIFRTTVLSTSIPWLLGNISEGGMRSLLSRSGPRAWGTGHAVAKRAVELDKVKGEKAVARTVGGGHFGSVERQAVHFNVDAMSPGKLKSLAQAASAFWRIGENHSKVPSPAMAANLWHGYTHLVFNTVNRAIETQIQTAMLGKALHDSDLMSTPLLKASQAAIDKAARGILDQNTAASLGRQIDIAYGKYGKWSPDMRKAVALYTPFVAWTLNASYFVLRTLPRDHPVALTLIAATENATDEWRKEHGLDQFIEGHVPGWLQGSIPGPGGSHFRAPNRYTPFSVASDPIGAWAGSLLPQAMGVYMAGAKGLDWQGHPLEDDGTLGKAKEIVKVILNESIPGLAAGQRVVTKGPKAATVDTVVGKVAPSKKKATRRSGSSSKPGTIVGPGSGGGGRIVGPGSGSGGGKIVP